LIEFELLHVTGVHYVRDHILWLRFNDGVEGTVDLADLLEGPAFERLRDPHFFARARLEHGYTIGWPNGVDLAPEGLYERLVVTGTEPKRDWRREFDDAMAREAAQCARMPEVSRFFGIVIRMFWTEHEAPDFHAQYAEYLASVYVRDGAVTTRKFPPPALRRVEKWRKLHQQELLDNWERMRRGKDPLPIPPLE
jgi:hypothetical protein